MINNILLLMVIALVVTLIIINEYWKEKYRKMNKDWCELNLKLVEKFNDKHFYEKSENIN